MKNNLNSLFDQYYEKLNSIQKETIINQDNKKTSIIITYKKASQIWEMKNDRLEFDDQRAQEFIESERERIGELIFQMTKAILWMYDETGWVKKHIQEKTLTLHIEKVMWSEKALCKLQIRDPYDTMKIATVESKGTVLGVKRIPENSDDPNQKLMNEVRQDLSGLGFD